MRAVRLHGVGDLRVESVPEPGAPAGADALVRVLAAGICGSDLHNFRTGMWLSRAPSTPGHELAGEVIAVGPEVRGLRVGDRVAADSRVPCGTCPMCTSGRGNLCASLGFVGEVCDGGFAELTVLPARLLHKLPPGLDPKVAAMAEPLAVALHAVRRLAPRKDEPVLVAGCGPIGGLVALVLAEEGCGPILIADRQAARASLVAGLTGARIVTLDREAVLAAASGRAVAQAVDATGSIGALTGLLDVLGTGARLALVGIFHGRLDLDPNRLVEREVDLVGCSAFATELPEAIARLPALAAKLTRMIEGPIALEDMPAAYQRLIASGSDRLKTIMVP